MNTNPCAAAQFLNDERNPMKMSHKFAALICASMSLASASALAAMSNEEFVQ